MSSSLLEEPAVQAATGTVTGSATSHAERLRTTMMAMRLSFMWFGTRKTLSPDQKDQAAESFGAEGSFLSAGKKLIDVKHPAFKAVWSQTRLRLGEHLNGQLNQRFRDMKAPAAGEVAERCLSHIARNPPRMEGTNNQADGSDHGNGELRAGFAGLMFITQDQYIVRVSMTDGIGQCSQLACV